MCDPKLPLVAACLLLFSTMPAMAEAQDPGAQRHDGFLLRYTSGLGEFFGSVGESGTDSSIERIAGMSRLELGGALVDNFVLAGVVGSILVLGDGVGGSDELPSSVDVDGLGFGVAVSYYFVPVNIYVRVDATYREMTLEFAGACDTYFDFNRGRCEFTGIGVGLGVGKEWWVSDNWGLGIAAQLDYIDVDLDEQGFDAVPMTLGALGINFSATYN